jgi:CMP-N,N'-diacetyllegionaminic acid synthase
LRTAAGPLKRSEHGKPTILGIIPARGGSKAIPRKNLAVVANKPLIAWTVEVAVESGLLDRLVVSTDDREIAVAGKELGAEVPFLRPTELATDTSTSMDVVLHAIQWLDDNEQYRPDYILLLQPTSPLRTATDIRESMELLLAKNADSVVSVCETRQHPLWMKGVNREGKLVDLSPPLSAQSPAPTRRQDLPSVFAVNGAIYLALRSFLMSERTFISKRTHAYVMPENRSLDVDTPWDLYLADLILRDREHRETV